MFVSVRSRNISLHRLLSVAKLKYCSLRNHSCIVTGSVQINRLFLCHGTKIFNKNRWLSCKQKPHIPFSRCYSSDNYFSVSDYDCVGFDLDNTICEYNLNSVVRHEYNIIAEYLVKEVGHDENVLSKPLLPSDVDFLQKGLIIDTDKGNLLRTRRDGFIFKACHGSKFLNDDEIIKCYGQDRKWYATTEFAQNPVTAWNGPLAEKLRTLADYFDMPAALALSRCIHSKKASLGDSVDYANIWKEVLKSLIYIYDRKSFALNEGYFKTDVKVNPDVYYYKCRPAVIDWLKELKKHKVTFLITGSNADHASHTAAYCLGDDWRDYFDIVIGYSRKPGFFVGGRPFVKLENFVEKSSIKNEEIKAGEIYSQGNWQGLLGLLAKMTKKSNPKCLYVGDNLIQDIFTVAEYTCCDTVAVSEELNAEFSDHPHKDFLTSKVWGSYFNANDNTHSLWGDIIRNYAKVCVPSLDVFASKAFDYKFSTFSDKSSGYHLSSSPLDLSSLSEFKKRTFN